MPTFLLRTATLAAALLPALAIAGPLSLDQALELALQRSESARAARAGVASAAETARAAGRLPDPVLRAGIENLPVTGAERLSSTSDSQTMKRVGISQEWLSPVKRAARQAAAEAQRDRQSVQVSMADAETRLQTALAYLDASFAAAALELVTRSEHHAHEELTAARARLASATGSGADALALASALGLAEDETADARQQQRSAGVALQRWVGVPADELAPLPLWQVPAEQDYVAGAPAVLAAQRDVAWARRAAAVTAAERHTDWTWEISYGQRSGQADMLSFGVSIPLPLAPAERQDRETAAKLALVDQAEAELAEATRAASAEYRTLDGDAGQLQQRVERFGTAVLMPAQQRSAAALAAYRSNQGPLASLFEARHAELEALRRLLNLQRELAKTRARLAFKPLTAGDAP